MRNLLLQREPVFTATQLSRLSNIVDNAGQVALGAGVLSPLLTGVDRLNPLLIVLSLVITLILWSLSIMLARTEKSQ